MALILHISGRGKSVQEVCSCILNFLFGFGTEKFKFSNLFIFFLLDYFQRTNFTTNLLPFTNVILQVVLCRKGVRLFSPSWNAFFSLLFVSFVLLFHFAIAHPIHNPHYSASQDRNAEDNIVIVVAWLCVFILCDFSSYDLFKLQVYRCISINSGCWHFLDCKIVIEPELNPVFSFQLQVS